LQRSLSRSLSFSLSLGSVPAAQIGPIVVPTAAVYENYGMESQYHQLGVQGVLPAAGCAGFYAALRMPSWDLVSAAAAYWSLPLVNDFSFLLPELWQFGASVSRCAFAFAILAAHERKGEFFPEGNPGRGKVPYIRDTFNTYTLFK
jgi:hypothetical protein